MGWSYSGNPADSAKDEVRFLIGDTDREDQLLSDEEITFLVVLNPKQAGYANWVCAAEAARAIAARLTKLISKKVGSLSLSYSDKARQYTDLANALDAKATSGNNQVVGAPLLGGGGRTYLQEPEWFSDSPISGS